MDKVGKNVTTSYDKNIVPSAYRFYEGLYKASEYASRPKSTSTQAV